MAKFIVLHEGHSDIVIEAVKQYLDDAYNDTWLTLINGQAVGVGNGSAGVTNLAEELAVKLTPVELLEMAEHFRQNDLTCPHCGHKGGAHWQGKCQHRVYPETRRHPGFCPCPGWTPNESSH